MSQLHQVATWYSVVGGVWWNGIAVSYQGGCRASLDMRKPSRRPLGVEHLLQLLHVLLVHMEHAVVEVLRGDSNTSSRSPIVPNPCDEAWVYTESLRNQSRCPANREGSLHLVLVGAETALQRVFEEHVVVGEKPVNTVVFVWDGSHRSLGWCQVGCDRCSRWGNVQGTHGLFFKVGQQAWVEGNGLMVCERASGRSEDGCST
ncbi:hypothetical protein B0H15DRAFT_241417 [Mycena belliarum]|uniref:Uncharacterized protein n=1 Tax=Mycena belliarum TaxID=1033014 RepID=A0AAD6XNM3_9AGAR|nr:hypothetical protein B0H15DRAFT_241417 [Mycena belliae]